MGYRYDAIHWELKRRRGKANHYVCEDCSNNAEEWSYDGKDPKERVEIRDGKSVKYSLDLDYYRPLCRSCHNKYDKKNGVKKRSDAILSEADIDEIEKLYKSGFFYQREIADIYGVSRSAILNVLQRRKARN